MNDRQDADYTLEFLIKTFDEHTKQSVILREEEKQRFFEYNPGEKLPAHYDETFNFPQALSLICSEILKLKEEIK